MHILSCTLLFCTTVLLELQCSSSMIKNVVSLKKVSNKKCYIIYIFIDIFTIKLISLSMPVFDLDSSENKFMDAMYKVWDYIKARLELMNGEDLKNQDTFIRTIRTFRSQSYINFYLTSLSIPFDQEYVEQFFMILHFFIQIFRNGAQYWYIYKLRIAHIDHLGIIGRSNCLTYISDSIPGFLLRIPKKQFAQIVRNGNPNCELFGKHFKMFGPLALVNHSCASQLSLKSCFNKRYSFTSRNGNVTKHHLSCTKLTWDPNFFQPHKNKTEVTYNYDMHIQNFFVNCVCINCKP